MPDRLHLVAYDVRDPRRLKAVRRAVTAWAHGGQRSVWECWARPSERPTLVAAVAGALDLGRDSLAVFDLPARGPFIALGRGRAPAGEALATIGAALRRARVEPDLDVDSLRGLEGAAAAAYFPAFAAFFPPSLASRAA